MIRACKSGIPKEKIIARLLKIWARRCALPREFSRKNELLQYGLAPLIEKYNPIKLGEFFRKMEPFELMIVECSEDSDYTTKALNVCISHLRFTESDKLPGYVVPLGFRNWWRKSGRKNR